MRKAFTQWLLAAVPITLLCIGMYAVAQQVYRQEANDPQIQMAQDAAARLSGGESPSALVERGAPPVDISGSNSAWLGVYDAQGAPLVSSAVLDNVPPRFPAGVFDTKAPAQVDDPVWRDGEYVFTWLPRARVRQAVVLAQTADKKYFVAAGRSLSLSEERTSLMGASILFGWAGVLALTFIWFALVGRLFKV